MRRTVVTLVDDIDEDLVADETVTLAVDGVAYELDLTAAHAAQLRADLATWCSHARRVTTSARQTPASWVRRSPRRVRARVDREQAGAVRHWARAHGHTVPDRGRVPPPRSGRRSTPRTNSSAAGGGRTQIRA